ncbi:MAG TPA: phosphoribosylanthranilate isomerase [Polyangiales bacterium]|nr:phosphoribosylanthranilate isomerase [Polyangiales bacterium]
MDVRVKICGVTSVEDALAAVAAGADAIGVNFAAASARRVDVELAREIVQALPAQVVSVGVFVDASEQELRDVLARTGLRCVQLHGDESPELLSKFLPHAYKAIRVRGRESLDVAARFPGEHVLLDAFVPGMHGGTGASFDWALAAEVARIRQVTLAGGLTPANVAQAVREVRPFCVDVASGVESSPRRKDVELMRAFVAAAKG